MAYTAVGSFFQNGTSGSTTVGYTTSSLGDVVILGVTVGSLTIHSTAISGGGCTTWTRLAGPVSDTTEAVSVDLWMGTVTTVGAVTATVTYSAAIGTSGVELEGQQFTAGLGASTVWAVDKFGTRDNTAGSTTIQYPSLTATAANELYVGLGVPVATGTAGSTPGFSYLVDTVFTNVFAYNLAASGTVAPTAGNSTASQSVSEAALLTASANLSLSRTASDTAAASDTATRAVLSFTRTTVDTAAATDVARRSFIRSASDTAFAADSVVRTVGKAVFDAASASDTAARAAQTFTRAVADVAAASDARPTVGLAARGGDSAPAVDTLARVAALTRPVPDVAAAGDTTSRMAVFVRSTPDSAVAVDTLGPPVVVHAVVASKNWPLMGFEVDFQNGPPSLPTVTRQSINATYRRLFVRKWNTARGRQYELDQVQAGTCNLMLPDPLELLNPDNTGSPFNTGGRQVTPYRSMWIWAMWPNQPGSGNIINPAVSSTYDPSFESGLSGWTGFTGSSVAQSTTQAFVGTQSMIVTQATPGQSSYGASNSFRTAPGVTYTFSAYVYPTGGATVTLGVNLADGSSLTSVAATVQNVWTRLSLTWLTVDTLELVYVYSTQANPMFYLDATMLEFGGNLSAFTATGPTLYPIFTGFVERYPTDFDMSGARAVRALQAVDALAILSRTTISQSYNAEVAVDSPVLYYPLSNPIPPVASAQLGTGLGPGAYATTVVSANGSINWAGDAHPDGTPAPALTAQNPTTPPTRSGTGFTEFVGTNGYLSLNPGTVGFSWECWARVVAGTIQAGTIERLNVGDSRGLNFTVPGFGGLLADQGYLGLFYNPDGALFNYAFPLSLKLFNDGQWHYMSMTVQAGSWRLALDGLPRSGIVSVTNVANTAFNTFYMEASTQYGEPQAQMSSGRVAVYNGVLPDARRIAHYQRGIGYLGEVSGARAIRLLSKYWVGAQSVATGRAALAQDYSYSGRTILDVLQEIQETERGLVYANAAGTVVVEDRTSRYLNQSGLWVFGENPAGASPVEYPYSDIKYDHDPTYTFSQANLSRPANNGFPPMVSATVAAKYGQRILTQTAQLTNDFDLAQAGVFYLNRYGTPKSRISTLILKPSANPALWPVVLSLDISQRITIKRRSAFTRSNDFYIEKVAHSVDASSGDWTTTLQLSPVFVPQGWVCGDATNGVTGSTTIPIY